MLGLGLAACGPVEPRDATDAAGRDGSASAGGAAEARAASAPDLERGELLSFACQACHTLAAGDEHRIGPNLHGFMGRPAASLPDFEYSDALRNSGIVWAPDAIDAWLADPTGYLPGTKMPFTGYRSAADRRDLVAYLTEATAPP
jgi:cytochrome c